METDSEFNYQDLLKVELDARIKKNSRYSMRAFARDLGMTPQMLGSVLSMKKDISMDSAVDISVKLGFDPDQSQDFIDAVILSGCKTPLARKFVFQRIEGRKHSQAKFKSIPLQVFKVISDWYHFAILELTTTENFKSDPKWIAQRLGISVFEVKEAINRLITLELLELQNGDLKKTELNLSALSDIPASALREHAKQIFGKGMSSLESQAQHERDVTSITMAIDPDRISEAKKMILRFRRKLSKFLEAGNRTEVYVFSPALFRLTKKQEKNQ